MSLLWCESCEAYESCVSFSNRRAHSHTVGGFSVAVGAALQQEVLEQSAHFNGTSYPLVLRLVPLVLLHCVLCDTVSDIA